MNQKATTQGGKPNALWWIVGMIALVIVSGIALVIYSSSSKFQTAVKQPVVDADAGFKKATNTMDPETIRAWALGNIRKHASQSEMYATMPKELRNLYSGPPDIIVADAGLRLGWGGDFFHWVFYVGDTNDTLPFHSGNPGYPYNFEWRAGIYYTREANMELQ